jgi:uncharacterized protein YjdB
MENDVLLSLSEAPRIYTFTVTGPRTLDAVFTPKENDNDVAVTAHPTEADIDWGSEPDADYYTLIIYTDAARTQEYARFRVDDATGAITRLAAGDKSCTVDGLQPATKYYYTLTSYDTDNYALNAYIGDYSTANENDPQAVTLVTVTPATADVQKGATQQFTATVTATGGASEAVTWTVNSTAGSTVVNGLLTVAAGETATTLTVTATSVFDNTKKGTATVTVKDEPVTQAVTNVAVLPATADVQKGATQQFTATVTATGGASEAVTWTVSSTAGSTVVNGLLTVAATETATTLTVTATSVFDNTKKGTATVTVKDEPVTQEVTGVAVSPATATVQKGATQQFTATVTATGGASEAVTWTVSSTAGSAINTEIGRAHV